ncbi:MAG: M23 family metallopeptidase [Gracilibacteraceae bacterium]|nr:M23 family metallopeptidase [Gracilibacteraceae bacterium]
MIYTIYKAHNSILKVRAGQKAKRGNVIAKVGSTGNSTDSHIHFEVGINGKHENPIKYFK